MQVFRPIEHAITDDGEWVTVNELPADYMGQLKCDSCHASVIVDGNKPRQEEFIHLRHTMQEIIKTRSCRYTIRTPASLHSPGTGMAMTRPAKTAVPVAPIPPIGPKILRINTTVRKWRCTWCEHRYYGTKQCPLCGE